MLQLPASALFRAGGQWAVYVVEDGRARSRQVQAGAGNGLQTQILAGLAAGTVVVAHPDERLHDGARVAAARP